MKLISLTSVLAFAFMIVSSSAVAQEITPINGSDQQRMELKRKVMEQQRMEKPGVQKLEQRTMEQKENSELRQELVGDRCEIVTQKIQQVTGRYEMHHRDHVKKFSVITDRLNKIEALFVEKGADTTTLKAGIVTMETLLETLKQDYETFIASLESSKEFECGNSQGDFKTAMMASREALAVVKQDIQALQQHYRTVIRPELKKLQTAQ